MASPPGKVFISHASSDAAIARRVCDELERDGQACWIAPRDVTPGEPYAAEIVRAVQACGVFLILYSEKSNRSDMVMRELELASSQHKRLLPVKLDTSAPSEEMRFFLGREHWLDASGAGRDVVLDTLAQFILQPARVVPSGEAWRPATNTGRAGNFGERERERRRKAKKHAVIATVIVSLVVIIGGINAARLNPGTGSLRTFGLGLGVVSKTSVERRYESYVSWYVPIALIGVLYAGARWWMVRKAER